MANTKPKPELMSHPSEELCCYCLLLLYHAAAWLSKHGHLLSELQLHMGQNPSDRAAAATAVAAALHEAAASSRSGNLHITSCKLRAAGPDSADILQALPASKLTSLEFEISIPDETPTDAMLWDMAMLGRAISSLQQLRQLRLSDCIGDAGVGLALRRLSNLTNLTSLTMPQVTLVCITGVRSVPIAHCCSG
jgi:hypothetical protein